MRGRVKGRCIHNSIDDVTQIAISIIIFRLLARHPTSLTRSIESIDFLAVDAFAAKTYSCTDYEILINSLSLSSSAWK